MLAKTTTHRQRYWLKQVEAADVSDGMIAEYAVAHDVSLKGASANLYSLVGTAKAKDWNSMQWDGLLPALLNNS